MSDGVNYFKVKLNDRLAAMAREISELFDGMIAVQEREMQMLKQKNMRQQQLLDSVLKPHVVLLRTDVKIVSHLPGDVDSTSQHIKEEQEELSIKQEHGEPQEFTCSPLAVKCEDEENKPSAFHPSSPEQNRAGNNCLRSEPQQHTQSETVQTKTFDKPPRGDLNISSSRRDVDSSDTDDSHEWGSEPTSGEHKSHGGSKESVNDKEVIFECPRCLKTFLRKGQTPSNHSERKGLTCEKCSVGSKRRGTFHIKSSNGKKTFSCIICNKGFTREDNLNTHMLIHKGVRPYVCTVCEKAFTESGHLKAHVRTHTGEKPFSCSVCKKCFTHRATRDRHERNHSGERPYSCSHCRAQFKQRAHYLSHLRVHSRERPFSCPVCNKTYSRNSHVTSHMKVHTRKPI